MCSSDLISALILLFALLFPKEKIFFFGLIPIPAIWGAVLLVSLDLRGLFLQSIGNEIPIGYGAHLGGALFAYLYFLFLKRLEGSL